MCTLLVEKGTFTKTTSTSAPVSQQVTLSNGSLTPKLLILWTVGQTTNNGTYTDDARITYGFSDGTNDACQAFRVDESLETESYTFRNDSVIAIINLTTNAIVSQADVSAFAAGSFTLNWSVQSNTEALHIHYMVAGGTDLTNVSCVSTTAGDTLTGNHSYNGSGTTFTPDFALIMTGGDGYDVINTLAIGADQSTLAIGAAKSTTQRFAMYGGDETVGTSDCDTYINPNACIARGLASNRAVDFLADFVSFNNAAGGGITVNMSDGAGAAADMLAFLFVKGGVWDCGGFQQRSGTGTQDVTLTTGLDPALVFLAGTSTASSATVTPNNYIGIGGSDGTNEGCSYYGNTNGLGTFAAVSTGTNTKVYRMATPNVTAASSTTNAECDISDMATTDKFTLNWTTADTTLRQMAFWALGSEAVAGNAVERALATETITLSDSRDRLAAKIRTRTDTAITLGETSARLSAKLRPIPAQTIIIGAGTAARVKGKVKSLTTETITVTGGTIARLLAKIRTGTDTTAIAEARNRLAAKNRALAAQTTTIGIGTIAIVKGKLRALAAETITVTGGTLARLGSKIRAIPLQTIALTENRARLKTSMRSLVLETIIISETRARLLSKIRAISLQTITTGESTARLAAKIRALAAQTVSITEDLQRALTAGAQNIVKTISQTVILSESIARLKASQRLTSQTIIIGAGTIARLSAKIRTISQTIVLVDNRARLSTKLRPIALQTITLSESRTRLKGAVKTISQTIILTENRARLAAKTRILAAQTIILADSVARQIIGGPAQIIRALTQTVVLSETLSRRLASQRILIQTVPKAESLARVRGVLRTLSQSIPVSESRSRIKSALRPISQTISTSDNLSRLNALRRTVTQTTILASSVAQETVGNLVRSMVETVTVSDSIVRRTVKLVILAQTVVITEQARRLSTKLRTIPAQTIILNDSVTQELNVIIKHAIRTLSQVIVITDYAKIEVVKKSQRFRKILDPSINRLKSNHPAWFLGSRGMHDHFEEFSP